jgi:hypothetical protein
MGRGTYIFLCLLCLPGAAWARSARSSTTSGPVVRAQKKEPPKESAKGIFALTLRPTWIQNDPTFQMENTVEAGIQFHPNFSLSYAQDFNTNTSKTGSFGDFTPSWQDGFLRFKFNNVSQSDDKLFTYNHQLRVYLPIEQTKRDAGFITAIRNYFLFDRKVSSALTFTVYEVPILHIYDRAGSTNSKGEQVANPLFENRFILEPTISLLSNLQVGLPLNLYLVRYQDFGETAKKSGEWIPSVTFSPWIEWQMVPAVALGFYYETATVAEKTDAGLVWTDGQKAGYYQAYIRLGL